MKEWPADEAAKLPANLKPLFASRNTRVWAKEAKDKPPARAISGAFPELPRWILLAVAPPDW